MLGFSKNERVPGVTITSYIIILGIIVGSLLGHFKPDVGDSLGDYVDYTLLALVGTQFFCVRFSALLHALKNLRFLCIALFANFIVIPVLGYGIASLFLSEHPLFIVGLVIYFMSPCTDWFLSFTRLSGGNVALGTTLIPINMTTQLLLYPFFLQLFTQHIVQVEASVISATLLQWFLQPLVAAIVLRQVLRLVLNAERFERILSIADHAIPWITALLILQIFSGNIAVIMQHLSVFAWVLLAVFTFFVLTFLLTEALSRFFKLQHPEHALLTMTTAARNAPLMLAVTMAALPNQPLIHAPLVIGMLVEFPHLTALRQLLIKGNRRASMSKVSAPA